MAWITQCPTAAGVLPARAALALLLVLGGAAACTDSDDKETDGNPSLEEGDGGTADGGTTPDAASGTDPDAPQQAADGLLITLADGKLEGDMTSTGARRFLKIPYAKPPVGELRWKKPVPNDAWQDTRHESEFPQSCAQLMDQGSPASDNEDCLYLNVWSPEPAPDKAPVLVWIHGGGNFSGGTGIPLPSVPDKIWYDGQYFASKQGVVLVTIQYRLGPLGFFAHSELGGEDQSVGNQGLLDQRMALQWVKKNIAKFGGDPGNVTIFGESAGSADVCYHVASPGSRDLFHRAISQSGGCTIRSVGPEQAIDKIGSQMAAYGAALGCPEGAGQLACMRGKSIPELLAMSMQPMPGAGGGFDGRWSFAAVLDGPNGFLPDTPQALFDRGDFAKVPYLLGSNNDEGTTFVIRATPLTTDAEYMADLQMRYKDKAAEVYALYAPSKFNGDFNAARARHIGDSGVVCSTHDTARRAAKAGAKVFLYNFNVPWAIAGGALKVGHAGEIGHAFGDPYLPMPDPHSEAVGAGMNGYWAQFAKAGDPNRAGAPAQWPEFKPDADKRLQLDPMWQVLDNFRTEECNFWRKYHGVE
jgi:para-nitrobenzyl esterase